MTRRPPSLPTTPATVPDGTPRRTQLLVQRALMSDPPALAHWLDHVVGAALGGLRHDGPAVTVRISAAVDTTAPQWVMVDVETVPTGPQLHVCACGHMRTAHSALHSLNCHGAQPCDTPPT